jgi:glycerol-3-phosphate dehydrogenase
MNRDLARLARNEFDLVVVGGGIYGICSAWNAAIRGLSVAIVEREDFCCATSANSLKLVHGGFRYIQHLDFRRIRESIHERRVLLRIAPHLVHPIPFLIPTYGLGMRGKGPILLGLTLYNLLAFDRNRGLKDRKARIPWGRVVSRDESLRLFPALDPNGLTGGVIFYDGQMYNPPRLALSYLKSAAGAGAEAANYLEVTGFLRDGDRVRGVRARDTLTGDELDIRGKMVLNAGGPWVEQLLQHVDVRGLRPPVPFSKDLYIVLKRSLAPEVGLAVPSRHMDPNAILSRGRRHLFIIPWKEHTLIGSSHVTYEGTPDDFAVTDKDLQELVDEINESYPALKLTREDVSFYNAGLVPMGENEAGVGDLRLAQRFRIIDHEAVDGLSGLISVIGIRWTTSGDVAEKAVDLVFRRLGQTPPQAERSETPVHGGEMDDFGEFAQRERQTRPFGLSPEVMDPLLRNHGTAYPEVLEVVGKNPELGETIEGSKVIKAEVVHAIRAEMAQKLGDVVFRRTDLGTAGHPGETALENCAALMAAELKWDAVRVRTELDEVRGMFP